MHKITYILFLLFVLLNQKIKGQCSADVDVSSLQHVVCPNGGAVGSASILQDNYTNYFWENITTGQSINSVGNTSCSNLNDGLYVIFATDPNNQSCPWSTYSDTFEILEASPTFNYTPDQACPDLCNVSVNADMEVAISGVSYTMFFNSNFFPLPVSIQNQCGGLHNYTILADGVACNSDVIGVSQFAPMNLQTNVIDQNCNQPGSAEVLITGVGAAALNTYCASTPWNDSYSNIENISIVGDNTLINNNTVSQCNAYSDYTSFSADVTPGNSYTLNVNLGTCHPQQAWIDLANIFVDWNIDGDFDDANELVAQINPIQSPSSHVITLNVPSSAIPGQSRMRIVSQSTVNQSSNSAQACDDQVAYFGETEDYTIIVNGSVATPVSYLWSDGQNSSVASNLSSGTYYVTVTDANGCSSSDTAIVNGGASNISVTATFDQTICPGYTPSSLNASSGGVTGTYSWVDDSDPLVVLGSGSNFSPPPLTTTTTYTVTFTDLVSGCIATDQVTITVNPIPTATLSVIPNPACVGENILLTATASIPVNQFRFQYNNGGGWINMTSPPMGNNNPITYNNITNTTQFRVRVREGTGCGTGPWSPIILVPISVIATQPINHN